MANLLAEAGSSSWIMLVVLGGLFVLMLVMTIIPQKKRKKQAAEMMSNIVVGSKVKTIGGFVGEIVGMDDTTGTININIGSEETPVLVTMDRSAIYTVLNPITPIIDEQTVVTEAGTVVEETDIVSLDDIEEAASAADRNAARKAKKALKTAEKDKAEGKTEEKAGDGYDVDGTTPVDPNADEAEELDF